MNLDFLEQDNWPKLGSGSHSQSTRDIHNWCSQLSSAFLELFERFLNDSQKQLTALNQVLIAG